MGIERMPAAARLGWLCSALLIAPSLALAQNAAAPAPAAAPAAAPASAPATPAAGAVTTSVVFLKNGGFVRGQVMEARPNAFVRLKLADGTVREVPWAEVERVADIQPAGVARAAAPSSSAAPVK